MKKLIICLFIIGIFLIVYPLLTCNQTVQTLFLPEIYQPGQQLSVSVADTIDNINNNTSKINSFEASIEAKAYAFITIPLYGNIQFEKTKKCNIWLNSFLGRECEIGSNDKEFWFYSRRMVPPVLHYASHDNIERANLKGPFNPSWIVSAMGLEKIQLPNQYKIEKEDTFIKIICQENKMIRIILIDPATKSLKGQYLYDENNKLNACMEILENYKFLPKKIRMVWIDDGDKLMMDWTFNNIKINNKISSLWLKPTKYQPHINMSSTAK